MQDGRFVFDEQHGFHRFVPARSLGAQWRRLGGFADVPGQVDPEGRADAGLAGDGDKTAVLLDDAIDHGQTESGALARRLRVKKGSKIRSSTAFDMPEPLSLTASTT